MDVSRVNGLNNAIVKANVDKLKEAKKSFDPIPDSSKPITISENVGMSDEQLEQLKLYLNEITRTYVDDMRDTQRSFITSYHEFDAIKQELAQENPSLDLSDLDLSLSKEGELTLTSDRLSKTTLDRLSAKLHDNEVLKDAMNQLHEGLVANLHFKSSDYRELTTDHFKGAIRLNEFIDTYSGKFHKEGFGRDLKTKEERLSVDPMLFGHFLTESLHSSVNTSA